VDVSEMQIDRTTHRHLYSLSLSTRHTWRHHPPCHVAGMFLLCSPFVKVTLPDVKPSSSPAQW